MELSWYEKSHWWIKEQQLINKNMNHTEIRKHCSNNYPFIQKSGSAYKGFLKAMRNIFGATRTKKNEQQFNLPIGV